MRTKARLQRLLPKTFTARLYWTIVLAIAFPLIGLSYWSGNMIFDILHREKDEQLMAVARYLDYSLPGTFEDILKSENAMSLPREKQLEAIKNKLQPVVNLVTGAYPEVGVGYYDRKVLNSRVAYGPNPKKENYKALPENSPFLQVYKTGRLQNDDGRKSGIWGGKPISGFTVPIIRNGQIIGHIYVNAKIEDIAKAANGVRMAILGLALFLIILALLGSKLIIAKAEKSLINFAEQVKNGGEGQMKDNLFPELNPLLEEIRELNIHRKMSYEQEKLAVIGQMAAGMAHEIRNPLTSVKGLAQVISNRLDTGDKQFGEYLKIMVEEINRANIIIRDFLAFAKPKQPMFQLVSANEIIEETSVLIDNQCLMKSIRVIKELDPEMPLCQLDIDQIKQVIINMTHNAIDAMEGCRRKVLTLKTRFLSDAGQVVITIADTGTGIPAENLKRLGTPFFTTKSKGTGLGLSVSYKIIESHAGRIAVESKEGEGTIFTIILPCRM